MTSEVYRGAQQHTPVVDHHHTCSGFGVRVRLVGMKVANLAVSLVLYDLGVRNSFLAEVEAVTKIQKGEQHRKQPADRHWGLTTGPALCLAGSRGDR